MPSQSDYFVPSYFVQYTAIQGSPPGHDEIRPELNLLTLSLHLLDLTVPYLDAMHVAVPCLRSCMEDKDGPNISTLKSLELIYILFEASISSMSRTAISGDEVVEQLIATNSVDMRDADSDTALFWTAKKGKLSFVERLLDTGCADPNTTDVYH
ncbi:hypothetical protein OIDMADRAFT_61709 [Oidiodendron maius Zn]|uniref:Uncharacterized protein n=1 Tax=Oidiodendron maius (strain Zn) TaxID=913774 RepID=A0A0C3GPP9_OIDMZ|nr:hypothetical protein OIDMADRAFT_61709 [Oidiodendron maius Zn]